MHINIILVWRVLNNIITNVASRRRREVTNMSITWVQTLL